MTSIERELNNSFPISPTLQFQNVVTEPATDGQYIPKSYGNNPTKSK